MAKKSKQFSHGVTGSAITVRLAPAGERNKLVDLLEDGTLAIQLIYSPADERANKELVQFIGDLLGTPTKNIDVLAGKNGKDKLITILDMSASQVQEKVLARINPAR